MIEKMLILFITKLLEAPLFKSNDGQDYVEFVKRCNINKNRKLKMFCILYNCIAKIYLIII